jgi:hypothetical protein
MAGFPDAADANTAIDPNYAANRVSQLIKLSMAMMMLHTNP